MMGRIIVTGATGSMGSAATEALARQGIPVLTACRNLEKADAVRTNILHRVPGADIEVRSLDLSSMASVRAFANGIDPGIVATDMIDLGHWYDPLTDLIFKPLCNSPQAGIRPALRALTENTHNSYYVGNKCKDIPRRYIDPSLDERIWAETRRIFQLK